jgi:hypothetical protein
VPLVRTEVVEEFFFSIVREKRNGELGRALAVTRY